MEPHETAQRMPNNCFIQVLWKVLKLESLERALDSDGRLFCFIFTETRRAHSARPQLFESSTS